MAIGADDPDLHQRLVTRYEPWRSPAEPDLVSFGIELALGQSDARGIRALPRLKHGSDVLFTSRHHGRLEAALDRILLRHIGAAHLDARLHLEMGAVVRGDRCVLVPLDTLWTLPERLLDAAALVPIDQFVAGVSVVDRSLIVEGLTGTEGATSYAIAGVWLRRFTDDDTGDLSPARAVAELVRLTIGFDRQNAEPLLDRLVEFASTVPVSRQPEAPAVELCRMLVAVLDGSDDR